MGSVLDEVRKAEEQQSAKKNSRHRFTKATCLAWTTAVNKINTFSTTIEVLVSSHPEYAALVWGSIKFLFLVRVTADLCVNITEASVQVTLNHQELSSKISDAFSAISDALPEVDFLASELYPVPHIQATLAAIYAHIIDFCTRALRWYSKTTGSFIRKTWAAIKDPWALEFDDVVRQIQHTTMRIREQAAVAQQAETRYLSSMVSQMQQLQQEVLKLQRERNLSDSRDRVLSGKLLGRIAWHCNLLTWGPRLCYSSTSEPAFIAQKSPSCDQRDGQVLLIRTVRAREGPHTRIDIEGSPTSARKPRPRPALDINQATKLDL